MKRGDVKLVRVPHPSGVRGKKRPAVVIQSDLYAGLVTSLVVAEITSNVTMANDPASLFLDLSTAEGRATGILHDSTVSCLLLYTVYSHTVDQVIGTLSPAMMQKLNDCLKAALELP